MSDYLPAVRGGLFPSRLERATDQAVARIEAQSIAARSSDRAALQRLADTTELGMKAAAYLGNLEDALVAAAPTAREEIRAVRQAGTIGVIGIVGRAGMGF
jgi:Mg2+ and Co2+ transporter CorA